MFLSSLNVIAHFYYPSNYVVTLSEPHHKGQLPDCQPCPRSAVHSDIRVRLPTLATVKSNVKVQFKNWIYFLIYLAYNFTSAIRKRDDSSDDDKGTSLKTVTSNCYNRHAIAFARWRLNRVSATGRRQLLAVTHIDSRIPTFVVKFKFWPNIPSEISRYIRNINMKLFLKNVFVTLIVLRR